MIDFFLSHLRNEKFTFVELGCYQGNSLRLWKEYFQNSHIIGVDINPEYIIKEDRIECIKANVVEEDITSLLLEYSEKYGKIYCIIDDCEHSWSGQRLAFEKLFPILDSGGFYIIEDLEFGVYGDSDWECPPKILDSQPFFNYIQDRMNIMRISTNCKRTKYHPYFSEIPKYLQDIELSIDMISSVPGAFIIRKK